MGNVTSKERKLKAGERGKAEERGKREKGGKREKAGERGKREKEESGRKRKAGEMGERKINPFLPRRTATTGKETMTTTTRKNKRAAESDISNKRRDGRIRRAITETGDASEIYERNEWARRSVPSAHHS